MLDEADEVGVRPVVVERELGEPVDGAERVKVFDVDDLLAARVSAYKPGV